MSEPTRTGPADWDEVAALVRDAGGYVAASPQLRPRVVEAVRRVSRHRRGLHHLACAAVASLALTAGLAAFGRQWQTFAPPRGVTSEQLHRLAGDRAASTQLGFDWALSEVVTNWRAEMAAPYGCGAALRAIVEPERKVR